MIFVITNEDPTASSIKFGIGNTDFVNLQNSFYPDTNIIHDIPAGGVYIDSFLCNKNVRATCRCLMDKIAENFVHFKVLQNGAYSRAISVQPGCVNCLNQNVDFEIPESTTIAFTDTLKFSTACFAAAGKVVIDSVGFASRKTMKDIDTSIYDPDSDGCLWGSVHVTFYPDDSITVNKQHAYFMFWPDSAVCTPSSYEKVGFKAGAEFRCVYTGPMHSFGSLCTRQFDIPEMRQRFPFVDW